MTRSQSTSPSSQIITMARMLEEKDDEIDRLHRCIEELRGAVQLDMVTQTYPRQVLFVLAKMEEGK